MKIIQPDNADFCNVKNGNTSIIADGIVELLKLHQYPITIQFDCEEDVIFFAEQVLKYASEKKQRKI